MSEFDRFADNYRETLDRSLNFSGESSDYFLEYKARYVARTVGTAFSGKVLDFGCGVGILTGFLRKHLPHAILHGYDVSAKSIEMTGGKMEGEVFFTSDLSRLDSDYDLVILSNVLHHVPPGERIQTVSQGVRMLAGKGRVIIFEHNPFNPLTRWVVRHCPFDEDAVLLPMREACSCLRNSGLTVKKREYILFFPRILSVFRSLEPLLSWFPLGAQYAVMGEKHG